MPDEHRATALGQIGRLLGSLSLRQAATVYAEEWIGSLLRPVPSLLGCGLRFLFYRLLFSELGGFGYISRRVEFVHSYGMRLGRNHHINVGCHFDARGGLTIGENVLFGPNVVVVSSQHQWDADPKLPIIQQGHRAAAVSIGDDCWIGANAVITPGVAVGTGTIVGAGSVVTSSTEPYSIVAGSPARVIGQRER
ncbi:MAG: acyltransferase [Myxococcota bacterium]|jgi:acetyltransferase-like isoleucine patch superfamily enzyme